MTATEDGSPRMVSMRAFLIPPPPPFDPAHNFEEWSLRADNFVHRAARAEDDEIKADVYISLFTNSALRRLQGSSQKKLHELSYQEIRDLAEDVCCSRAPVSTQRFVLVTMKQGPQETEREYAIRLRNQFVRIEADTMDMDVWLLFLFVAGLRDDRLRKEALQTLEQSKAKSPTLEQMVERCRRANIRQANSKVMSSSVHNARMYDPFNPTTIHDVTQKFKRHNKPRL